ALIAYFLRVDARFGGRALRDELVAPAEPSGVLDCANHVLQYSGDHFMPGASPELEAAALGRLDVPRPQVRQQVIRVLQRSGSPAAEDGLWRALETWNRGPPQRRSQHETDPALWSVRQRGHALAEAIWQGQGWLAGERTMDRLLQLGAPVVDAG